MGAANLYFWDRLPSHDRRQLLRNALTLDEQNAALERLSIERAGYWSPLVELKPCPFSGYRAQLCYDRYGKDGWFITCTTSHCSCRMSIGPREGGSLAEEWMEHCEGVDGYRQKVVECDIHRIARMWNRRAA